MVLGYRAHGRGHPPSGMRVHDDGRVEELPLQSKYAVGHAILDRVAARLG